MSVIRFRTTVNGDLSTLSYIFRKAQPMGEEFKTMAYYVTVYLIFVYIKIDE